MDSNTIKKVTDIMTSHYPCVCSLEFNSPYQLLVATILSAQCKDSRVNEVTRVLFDVACDPFEMVKLSFKEVERIIHPCGISRNKASNILKMSNDLIEKYNGEVPGDMDKLMDLAGVGLKTANVVLANAFGQDLIAVDTHVFRVSHRLGMSDKPTAEKTCFDLYDKIEDGKRTKMHHAMINHGREICKSQNPRCEECLVNDLCEKLIER